MVVFRGITTAETSARMARIKSKGNKSTELKFVQMLKKHRLIGWKRHPKKEGSPDFIFPKFRTAIFLDGCYWHGCPKCYRQPKVNQDYWIRKLARNQAKDAADTLAAKHAGWKVLRLWECQTQNESFVMAKLKKTFLTRKRKERST